MLKASFLLKNFVGFVCEEEGKIIGYIGSTYIFEDGEILLVAVDDCYRRKGYAQSLIEKTAMVLKENGVENLSRVVDVAEKRGVNIAIENCEGEEYLGALLDAFSDCQSVGFCWDTGHEKCYNRGLDMMERFGSRIICTHVNDNMGVRDPEGRITPKDDLHLLPFDGINDWASVKKRLNDRNYSGILTFELKKSARYDNMTSEEFLIEAYNRARRIAEL